MAAPVGRLLTFEIRDRAAAGRIGRFRTAHGDVTTPTLMPVVNPNIDLVSPREMREHFGCEMVITNSYVIHKHDDLRERALSEGVHKLIDWDGPVMTDSGTFQMYVYGDVEVAPDDIVRFQADMGVDVATCLDLFVTPDVTRQEAEHAVAETVKRTRSAADVMRARAEEDPDSAGRTIINATVQGGVNLDLRKDCAAAYRDLDVGYHTIGGVVPVMERQMYPELVEMILWSQQALRKDRPVHLFGAGHPLVFPLAVALGCDLFDSSSYAKYAADGRVILPEGTVHVADFVDGGEWPFASRFLQSWTPRDVQKDLKTRHRGPDGRRKAGEAEKALAMHNLDVCFADLRRIRQAIREGTLWELVEQRAAAHPYLAAATRKLGEPEYQAWLEAREPLSGNKAMRYTGSLSHRRPGFARISHRMATRFTPLGTPVPAPEGSPYAEEGQEKREVAMHKEPKGKPFGASLGRDLDAEQDHMVICGFGPVPLGLDEAYPFAQSVLPRLEGLGPEHMGWVGQTKDRFLAAHDMMPGIPGPPGPSGRLDVDRLQVWRTADWQFGVGAGAVLTGALNPDQVQAALTAGPPESAPARIASAVAAAGGWTSGQSLRCERSRATGKIRTVHLGDKPGEHILSLRAGDGLWTLKPAGARLLHAALPAPALRVVVADDSVPFNRDGKSVFAQFVDHVDADLRPDDECLVVDGEDALVAVGRLLLNAEECADFQGGMAVKVRDGLPAGVDESA